MCARLYVCSRVYTRVHLGFPHSQDLPAAHIPAGDAQASPGMESWWRGTSQSRGHSADIQSAFAFLLPDRRGSRPASLTCVPIIGEPTDLQGDEAWGAHTGVHGTRAPGGTGLVALST